MEIIWNLIDKILDSNYMKVEAGTGNGRLIGQSFTVAGLAVAITLVTVVLPFVVVFTLATR